MRNSMVVFHKDGDNLGITTDCTSKEDFSRECSEVLAYMIEQKFFEYDWEFQLNYWLPNIMEIGEVLQGREYARKNGNIITAGCTGRRTNWRKLT